MATSSSRTILILGCRGMLGSACLRTFGPEVKGCDLAEFDIADQQQTLNEIGRLAPRLIVNCAAATDVDRCELDREYADSANVIGPGNVAATAAAVGARMVHISTDFVFRRDKGRELSGERHASTHQLLRAIQAQGRRGGASRTAQRPRGAHLVALRRWGSHFPAKVLRWVASAPEIKVVNDQFGSPTYAEDLARALHALVETGARGIYHLGGAGCVSRYDWARETVALAGLNTDVIPARTSDFPLPASRPAHSCLDCSKAAALGIELPPWRDGLARYLRSRWTLARIVLRRSRLRGESE